MRAGAAPHASYQSMQEFLAAAPITRDQKCILIASPLVPGRPHSFEYKQAAHEEGLFDFVHSGIPDAIIFVMGSGHLSPNILAKCQNSETYKFCKLRVPSDAFGLSWCPSLDTTLIIGAKSLCGQHKLAGRALLRMVSCCRKAEPSAFMCGVGYKKGYYHALKVEDQEELKQTWLKLVRAQSQQPLALLEVEDLSESNPDAIVLQCCNIAAYELVEKARAEYEAQFEATACALTNSNEGLTINPKPYEATQPVTKVHTQAGSALMNARPRDVAKSRVMRSLCEQTVTTGRAYFDSNRAGSCSEEALPQITSTSQIFEFDSAERKMRRLSIWDLVSALGYGPRLTQASFNFDMVSPAEALAVAASSPPATTLGCAMICVVTEVLC